MEVEGRASNGNSLTLNLEHAQEKITPNDSYGISSAHTTDRGITISFYSQLKSFHFSLLVSVFFNVNYSVLVH